MSCMPDASHVLNQLPMGGALKVVRVVDVLVGSAGCLLKACGTPHVHTQRSRWLLAKEQKKRHEF